MHIEELKEGECGETETGEEQFCAQISGNTIVAYDDAKRVLVGAGGRVLFYPTLVYNLLRNKIQSDFRWWDQIHEFLMLGAVPFPADVPRLKDLGVHGVVTLNEPYETLVQTSLYHAYDINHLVIPTRDYLFAPSISDICQAVDFIHGNASRGLTTYVHCKAGRGRSTTIVLCYLVKHKHMTPDSAYDYVRSIRPRVHLASAQWQAVQDYYHNISKKDERRCKSRVSSSTTTAAAMMPKKKTGGLFEDDSVVVITESDLDGYDESIIGNASLCNVGVVACRVQFAREAAFARLSCLWLRSAHNNNASNQDLGSSVELGRIAGAKIQAC